MLIGKDGETFAEAWKLGNPNIIRLLWEKKEIRDFVEKDDNFLFHYIKNEILQNNINGF